MSIYIHVCIVFVNVYVFVNVWVCLCGFMFVNVCEFLLLWLSIRLHMSISTLGLKPNNHLTPAMSIMCTSETVKTSDNRFEGAEWLSMEQQHYLTFWPPVAEAIHILHIEARARTATAQ